ncbi:MAG: AMP-binding protein [Ignavibacteria bacterium]|nr:AMP-binding protein [Ignavibacteria bacterium]
MAERTLPALFEESVHKYPNNIMLWDHDGNSYIGRSYRAIHENVVTLAAGLLHIGIEKGDRIALISEGRGDWVIAELAILYTGAVNVPVSVKIDEPGDLKFRLLHSECKCVFISSSQRSKISVIKSDLPYLERVILFDSADDLQKDEIFVNSLVQLGKQLLSKEPDAVAKSLANLKEDDYANICYTSGTTADPKGIILSHRNFTANVEQSTALLPITEDFTSLLILPWDHAFAHTAGIYILLNKGASMAAVQIGKTPMETLRNIPKNIKEIRPTFLLSVPSLAKNFRKNIEKGIREKGRTTEKLFNFALNIAYDYNGLGYNRGSGTRKLKYPLYRLFDRILFSKIRESFGGRLQFFIGGGALLDLELQRFFYALGIPMLQGYGLTESAPVISANVPSVHKLGSSGKVVKNLDIRICDEKGNNLPYNTSGEIVVRGENVMVGYWKNEKATNEAIRDGWLYTGDLGYLSEDGFLYVLGRSKSLLISNDGEKYSPEGIEEALVEHSPYIDQIMLYNNQSLYTVALVVPNKEALLRYAREAKLAMDSDETIKKLLLLIESEILKFKEGGAVAGMFPERWIPSAIAVLGEGFTEQNHFLNSTLKMVRGKITEYYRSRIDFLYTTGGKEVCNHQNVNIIRKW